MVEGLEGRVLLSRAVPLGLPAGGTDAAPPVAAIIVNHVNAATLTTTITVHYTDDVAIDDTTISQADLTIAYDDAAGRSSTYHR